MEEGIEASIARLVETIYSERLVCGPMLLADIADLELIIRELELENDISQQRLYNHLVTIPYEDRKELGNLLEAQVI